MSKNILSSTLLSFYTVTQKRYYGKKLKISSHFFFLSSDLANPKSNKKTAGFTQEERDGFTELLNEGFIDSFRHLYPDVTDKYSYWTYMMNCRAKNVGW